jgi:hypothetical protein
MKVWYVTSNLNQARCYLGGGGGWSTAFAIGGRTSTSGGTLTSVERFTGSTWISLASLNLQRWGMGVTSSPGFMLSFVINGDADAYTYTTEYYNGVSWEYSSNTNVARKYLGAIGKADGSSVIFGGYAALYTSELYNGVSWITGPNLSIGVRWPLGGDGYTNTAQGLKIGGYDGSNYYSVCERYDDTSWLTVNSLNVARGYGGAGGTGISNIIVFGGYNSTNGVLSSTETFNGTSWAVDSATLNVPRYILGGAGDSDYALSFGGYNGSSVLNTTELYQTSTGWSGKIWGISSIGKIIGISKSLISNVKVS